MSILKLLYTRVYPKVLGLATWSENCKWYSSLPIGAVVSLFMSQSSEFYHHSPLCCFSTSVYFCKRIFRYRLSPETFGYSLICYTKIGVSNFVSARDGVAQSV
jgi:hypothetical protein